MTLLRKIRAERDQLRAALDWAMGSGPAPDGTWFGDKKPPDAKPYWWRTELRQIADEQSEPRQHDPFEQGGISDRLSNFDEWGDRKRDRS